MTVTVANVGLNNTFEYWRARTNDLSLAVNNYVLTVNNNPTIGDAILIGNFQSNTVYVGTSLSGGSLTSPQNLYVNTFTTFFNGISVATTSSFAANTTFNDAIILKAELFANNSYGVAGQVLTSNGTGGVYWGVIANTGGGGGGANGTVTQVNTGSGLTGGPILTSGTLSVQANTGLIANSTGVFVNAATLPGEFANSTNSKNINGNANNITAFSINQNLSTTSSPTFANVTINGAAAVTSLNYGSYIPSSNGLVRAPNTVTGTGTYTTTSTTTKILIQAWGGGGGGGSGRAGGQDGYGSGGGTGSYMEKLVAVSPGTGYSYSVGSGGPAQSSGGQTSFTVSGTTYSAGGGGGGGQGYSPAAPGGSAGSATNGDVNIPGAAGPVGGSGSGAAGSAGASTTGPYGGVPGGAYGTPNGGSVSSIGGAGGAGTSTGGSGGPGRLVIWEFSS